MNWLVPMDSVRFYRLQTAILQNELPADYYKGGVGGFYYKKDIKADTLPFHEVTYIVRDGNKITYHLQLMVVFDQPKNEYADLKVEEIYIRPAAEIRRFDDAYIFDLIADHEKSMKASPPPPIPPPPPPSND